MSFVLEHGAERLTLDLPDARTVRDLLNADEAARIREGDLVAEVDGTVLPLEGPVRDGARVLLRPPSPKDHGAWLFRVNRHGDRVRVGELLSIRSFQDARAVDVWDWTLDRIRAEVTAWRLEQEGGKPFFADPAAQALAARRFGGARRRTLRHLGRAAA